MYQDVENFTAAIDCYMDSLYRYKNLFGENHIKVAGCYQAIGHCYYLKEDPRSAVDFQEKCFNCLSKFLPKDHNEVIRAKAQLD